MNFKDSVKATGKSMLSVIATASLIAMGAAFGKHFYKAWDGLLTLLEEKCDNLEDKVKEKLNKNKEEKK